MRDVCERKSGGNLNSFLANERAEKGKPTQRQRIIEVLRVSPATCEELSNRLGIRYSACSARCSELRYMGVIESTGENRKTSSGAGAAILRAVPEQKELFA